MLSLTMLPLCFAITLLLAPIRSQWVGPRPSIGFDPALLRSERDMNRFFDLLGKIYQDLVPVRKEPWANNTSDMNALFEDAAGYVFRNEGTKRLEQLPGEVMANLNRDNEAWHRVQSDLSTQTDTTTWDSIVGSHTLLTTLTVTYTTASNPLTTGTYTAVDSSGSTYTTVITAVETPLREDTLTTTVTGEVVVTQWADATAADTTTTTTATTSETMTTPSPSSTLTSTTEMPASTGAAAAVIAGRIRDIAGVGLGLAAGVLGAGLM